MNSSSVPALALQPRSASRASWRRRIWRGEATTSVPSSHATSARHIAVPSCQGTGRSVVEVGHEHHVAVAALPGGHRVAVDGRHVDVDGEQVVAALGAVLDDLGEEVRRREALALQAPLHVGHGQHHRVDRAPLDYLPQLLQRHRA